MPAPQMHTTRDLVGTAGPLLLDGLQRVAAARGRCRLGLSGGRTPGPLFDWLATAIPPELAEQLWITWIDERHLPVDREELPFWLGYPHGANVRLAFERWLAHNRAGWVQPMIAGRSLEEDLLWFHKRFESEFEGALDVVLLGAGADGHIASLFPDHPALDAQGLAVAVTDAPGEYPNRISLTLPVLQDVELAVLIAREEGKTAALQAALTGDERLPLGRYAPRGEYHWVIERA